MAQARTLKVLIVAAEASSTHYAEKLMDSWKEMGVDVEAFGIGSKQMEAKGFECLGRSEELAVMGIQEVVIAFKKIYKVFYKLLEEADKRKPDCVILLDYPDFNLRIAKKMKKRGHKVIYYISPSIWAWRTSRVNIIKKYVDKIYVLFPFEVDFYKKYGVNAEFLGNPLLDDLKPELFDKQHVIELRQKYGVSANDVVLGLMPGSRNFELDHHLPVQIEAAEMVKEKIPKLKVMVFVAPNLEVEKLKSKIANLKIHITFVKRDPSEMVSLADFVICASGTATLTVGLVEKPMVIMYIMKKLTVFIGRRIMKMPKFFGLVNIVADKAVSQEFFQEKALAEPIAQEVLRVLTNPAIYEQEVQELKNLKKILVAQKTDAKGINYQVAESILRFLNK
jgi:lipid-A-disaccharide synthase